MEKVRRSVRESRISETPEQREYRLTRVRANVEEVRSKETPEKKRQRLDKAKATVEKALSKETPEKKRQRLIRVKGNVQDARSLETAEKKKQRTAKVKESMKKLRQCRQLRIQSSEEVITTFHEHIRDAADYICCSCHRLLYRISVVHFDPDKYGKVSEKDLDGIRKHRKVSAKGKEWICYNCHRSLKSGKIPCQAKINNLMLDEQPPELTNLNPLELRLISKRIPFMKMVGLPRGRQQAIHGPAVNVPAKVETVCQLFPRLPSECQLLPLKFKRRRKYKSHYMYDFVNPQRVLTALKWLKEHNPHYNDVDINSEWVAEAQADDEDLWEAMTGDFVNKDEKQDSLTPNEEVVVSHRQPRPKAANVDVPKMSGMTVVDVPADGNCLYSALCYQLERVCLQNTNNMALRKHTAIYMSNFPDMYKDFISDRVATDDLQNADTEQPTIEDEIIAQAIDSDTRQELRWQRYLNGVEDGSQWGDHIVLQAIADLYSLTVYVHKPNTEHVEEVTSRYGIAHKFHLGLFAQSHYVALVDYDSVESQTEQIDCLPPVSVGMDQPLNTVERCKEVPCLLSHDETNMIKQNTFEKSSHEVYKLSNDDSDDERALNAEDEAAFERNYKVQGLAYETSMMKENPDIANKILSVAPGESQKPIPLLSDEHFEELSNPDKYPYGRNALTTKRVVKIPERRYFNQRLLDCDGRFGKSVEYLLSAQYAIESKQVYGDMNHFVFRRASGKQFQGQTLSAGQVKNVEKMNELIKTDTVYKILKNIRGSPGYYQALFYDVLAMVRQLGIPTWFFTVSAADMQWPDVIQTIARQFGTELSDNDVKELSYAGRTLWLRSNPVTAARQFQYRLELLFKDVLMSTAKPLGNVIDYVIRIEFQARGSPHAHTLIWIKDAPKVDVNEDEEVCSFIDKHISCALPNNDPDLLDLVENLQVHNHSSYCRKYGTCRFRYPRPPSYATILAR